MLYKLFLIIVIYYLRLLHARVSCTKIIKDISMSRLFEFLNVDSAIQVSYITFGSCMALLDDLTGKLVWLSTAVNNTVGIKHVSIQKTDARK